MGEEDNIKGISDAISTRAFFDLKQRFEKLEQEIIKKHESALIKKIEEFERSLKQTVKEEIENANYKVLN